MADIVQYVTLLIAAAFAPGCETTSRNTAVGTDSALYLRMFAAIGR